MRRRTDPIDRLQDEIQELLDDLWQVPRFSGLRRGFRPQVDVVRSDDPPELHVVVELPGIEPEDVAIYADARTLVVTGERRRSSQGRYQQMELDFGPFQRRVALTEPVDARGARAEYRHGLLTITLPLARREPKPERVVIQVGRDG